MTKSIFFIDEGFNENEMRKVWCAIRGVNYDERFGTMHGLGMAVSGSYVEAGTSPDVASTIAYIEKRIHELSPIHANSPHVFTHRHE